MREEGTPDPALALGMVVHDALGDVEEILEGVGDLFSEVVIVLHRSPPEVGEALAALPSRRRITLVRSDEESYDLARNRYLERCGCPWLFNMDADERISRDAVARIRARLRSVPDDVGGLIVPVLNYCGHGHWVTFYKTAVMRVGPARFDDLTYHNSPEPSLAARGLVLPRLPCSEARIDHLGPLRGPATAELGKRRLRIDGMRRYLADHADDSFALAMLALEQLSIGQLGPALTSLERALAVGPEPRRRTARYLQAICHLRLDSGWAARPLLEELVADGSALPGVHCLLARLDLRDAGPAAALERLTRAMDGGVDDPMLPANASALAVDLDPAMAIELTERALAGCPPLGWRAIYAPPVPHNPFSVQDAFLPCYRSVFHSQREAHRRLGRPT